MMIPKINKTKILGMALSAGLTLLLHFVDHKQDEETIKETTVETTKEYLNSMFGKSQDDDPTPEETGEAE